MLSVNLYHICEVEWETGHADLTSFDKTGPFVFKARKYLLTKNLQDFSKSVPALLTGSMLKIYK